MSPRQRHGAIRVQYARSRETRARRVHTAFWIASFSYSVQPAFAACGRAVVFLAAFFPPFPLFGAVVSPRTSLRRGSVEGSFPFFWYVPPALRQKYRLR